MGYISQVHGVLDVRRAEVLTEKPEVPEALLIQLQQYGATVEIPEQPLLGLSRSALDTIRLLGRDGAAYWIEDLQSELIAFSNSGKAYELKQDLERLVNIAARDGATLHGELRVVGEESGDVSRFLVDGPNVTREQAQVILRWPNGTTEKFE